MILTVVKHHCFQYIHLPWPATTANLDLSWFSFFSFFGQIERCQIYWRQFMQQICLCKACPLCGSAAEVSSLYICTLLLHVNNTDGYSLTLSTKNYFQGHRAGLEEAQIAWTRGISKSEIRKHVGKLNVQKWLVWLAYQWIRFEYFQVFSSAALVVKQTEKVEKG